MDVKDGLSEVAVLDETQDLNVSPEDEKLKNLQTSKGKIPFPEIKVEKVEEDEVLEVLKPVVQQAQVEAVKKRIKAETEELSPGEKILLARYGNLVSVAVNDWGMSYSDVNYRVEQQGLLKEKEAEKVAKNLVSEAEAVLATIDLSRPEELLKHSGKLVAVRTELQLVADKVNKNWVDLAQSAGASSATIQALKEARQF